MIEERGREEEKEKQNNTTVRKLWISGGREV
jgi:hypothetical protein